MSVISVVVSVDTDKLIDYPKEQLVGILGREAYKAITDEVKRRLACAG